MALFNKINASQTYPYGEENAVGSFYLWLTKLFKHPKGYSIFFDKDKQEFSNRQLETFPNLTVQEIDTLDLTETYIGGKANKASVLFYIYVNHHLKYKGTRQLLRRGRDQIMFALKMAGIIDPTTKDFYIDPIYFYDFSNPDSPTKLNTVLTVKPGIQQRFIQDGELLQFELMVTLTYMETLT